MDKGTFMNFRVHIFVRQSDFATQSAVNIKKEFTQGQLCWACVIYRLFMEQQIKSPKVTKHIVTNVKIYVYVYIYVCVYMIYMMQISQL